MQETIEALVTALRRIRSLDEKNAPKYAQQIASEALRDRAQGAPMREALEALANAEAISGVRAIVAGWNGEGREGGPFQRHPSRLGATLPKTTCGAVYALDEAIEHAKAILSAVTSTDGGGK